MKNEIVIFEEGNVKLEVSVGEYTVWLSQNQISELFGKGKSTVNEHILNIFKDEEVLESEATRKIGISDFSTKPTTFYNLDVIISVGYRVNSKRGIAFRKWANKILKEYMLKGYVINKKRLEYLEKTVQLIDIASRVDDDLKDSQSKDIIQVINKYSKSLSLLDDYDHKTLIKPKGTINHTKITYDECINIINTLRFNEDSNLFALERNKGLESIIGNLYQSFDYKDIYETIEEKAANFLYLVVKNHVFIDGNKRIAAVLFIYFLQYYKILYKNNKQVIDNNTLTALTLLVAQSNPKEKDIITDLIVNFLV